MLSEVVRRCPCPRSYRATLTSPPPSPARTRCPPGSSPSPTAARDPSSAAAARRLSSRMNALHAGVVAVALQREDLRRERVHRRAHLRRSRRGTCRSPSRVNAPASLEEVERHHVRAAVRVGGAEAHRAEEAREEASRSCRSTVSVPSSPCSLSFTDHVQAEDVRLPFLERAGALLERRAHRALAVDRVLDAEAVRDLVEHHVLEERVEVDVRQLVGGDQLAARSARGCVSNFARIAFLSCSRRVPFLSCTSSSFGRLIAIVFAPAFACPA